MYLCMYVYILRAPKIFSFTWYLIPFNFMLHFVSVIFLDWRSGTKFRKGEENMSAYICAICKHFTRRDKNLKPYHCGKRGICR